MANQVIVLGNKESEISAIMKNVENEIQFFSTKQEQIEFLEFTVKNNPFGVEAAMRGFGKTIIGIDDIIELLNAPGNAPG